MTKPKMIIPGQVTMTTRRCSERRYFLLPATWLTEATGYLIAHLAAKYHISVHVACFLGNHGHLVLTDHMGLRPKFFQELHSNLTRIINARIHRTGSLWDNREPGDCVLADDAAVLDKTLYVATNPVHHGLVEDRADWEGFALGPEDWGVCHTYPRPDFFTGKNWPETATLQTGPPAELVRLANAEGTHTLAEIRDWATAKADARQAELVAARRASGRGFLTMDRVRQMSRTDAPETTGQHSTLNPRIATKDGATMARAKAELTRFRRRYRKARERWLAGDDEVSFPKGTYWYKHFSPAKTADDGGHVVPVP